MTAVTTRQRTSEILHIRVTEAMREHIESRALDEQRTVADMTRILIGFSLVNMPNHRLPTDFGMNSPKASNADVIAPKKKDETWL